MSDIAAEAKSRSRRRRRSGEAAPKPPFLSEQLEWAAASYLDNPAEPVNDEGVEAIHEASMRVLEDIGILFLNDDAIDVLEAAGCTVDHETKRVRMDRDFVIEMAAKAPSTFTISP
ncbi:MAG: trimethylamine methyltransferase family protein, partial [Alphaproteobacteria bacterium]|nr:trimethylamine methyltransferase family protein [Alphaproteobacteria bacterium]